MPKVLNLHTWGKRTILFKGLAFYLNWEKTTFISRVGSKSESITSIQRLVEHAALRQLQKLGWRGWHILTLGQPCRESLPRRAREGGATRNTGGEPPKEALCSSLPNADNHIIPKGIIWRSDAFIWKLVCNVILLKLFPIYQRKTINEPAATTKQSLSNHETTAELPQHVHVNHLLSYLVSFI